MPDKQPAGTGAVNPRLPASARDLLGRLSRDRVLVRRLPARLGGGRVLVSPDAALSFWYWNLDRTNGRFALAAAERYIRRGDRVFDIGGNLGLFALAAAYLAGEGGAILAVEPDPFFSDLIARSLSLPASLRATVEVLTAAAADSLGTARFSIARLGRASSHLTGYGGRATAGGERAGRTVMTVPLDWLAVRFGPPSFVKIDVEGAETAVLAGAAETLTRHRPRILIEVGPETAAEVGRVLTAAGYRLADDAGRPLPDPAGYGGDIYAEHAGD